MIPEQSGEDRPPFHVSVSGHLAEALRSLQRQADSDGRGKELNRAAHDLLKRLRYAPHSTGEPLYRLPSLRIIVRTVVIGPLSVDFGVCEDRPIVFLKGVHLLSGPGLS